MTTMKRIGVAYGQPTGKTRRQPQYGVFQTEYGVYARYEGYLEGNWMVGLPLGGPGAAHLQPLMQFEQSHYEKVTFFHE